jgi:hypothetical protein
MVDEMDLVRQLRDTAAPRPEAYERAWTTLRASMAESGPALVPDTAPVPGAAPLRRQDFPRAGKRRGPLGGLGKVGIGAWIGAAAAAVAIVLVATSTPRSAAPAGSSAGASTGPAAQAPAVGSKLVTLAADIKASGGSLSGDSSLVIETQVIGGKLMQVVYGLYTDSGALYSGDDKKTLTSAVAQHANLAESVNTREVAAARYAADGDLATARKQMVNATPNDYFLSFAARKKIWDKNLPALQALLHEKGSKVIPKMPNGQALQNLINGSVWNNAVDALNWGAANPEIRAGVLRLLSTIPQVTVAKSTVGGQPALTLTAGPALNYGGSQVLTINAKTGMPISWVVKLPQVKTSVTTYQVSRVTMAGVKAGKF